MSLKVFKVLPLILGLIFLASCGKNDGRLTEKANIEGEGQAQGQRKNEIQRAKEMENDLAIRQRFYQALSGTFNGSIKTTTSTGEVLELNVRFTFVPSVPPYKSDRSRALDEIIADLNNLSFNVEVLHWDPQDSAIVFGCVFEKIRPDLAKGTVVLAKDGCASLFTLHVFENDPANPNQDMKEVSEKLAHEILSGQKDSVKEVKGFRQSTKATGIFDLSMKR